MDLDRVFCSYGTPAELESNLEKFPEGTFAALARTRLEAAAQRSDSSPEPTAAASELSADSDAPVTWRDVERGIRPDAVSDQEPT